MYVASNGGSVGCVAVDLKSDLDRAFNDLL